MGVAISSASRVGVEIHAAIAIAAVGETKELCILVLTAEVKAQTRLHAHLGESARLQAVSTRMLLERDALRRGCNVVFTGDPRKTISDDIAPRTHTRPWSPIWDHGFVGLDEAVVGLALSQAEFWLAAETEACARSDREDEGTANRGGSRESHGGLRYQLRYKPAA